uniref:MalT-like TPR region domain-containing protein n=1 Tax=Trieres chinensis TaxID=1514140 RepID=A0A7S1ZAU3_TRICV|mmetsp:Transcript_21166/g.42705  ORF Transcript_21166/g.42705 Transcript_21166/m.42705 type:complete len:523 (+) Transcript_21166:87-1655(+)
MVELAPVSPMIMSSTAHEISASACSEHVIPLMLNSIGAHYHMCGDLDSATMHYNVAIDRIFNTFGVDKPKHSSLKNDIEALISQEEILNEASRRFCEMASYAASATPIFDAPHELEQERTASLVASRALEIYVVPGCPTNERSYAPVILHNIGLIFYQQRDLSNAMNMFRLALESLPSSKKEMSILAQSIYHHLGQLYAFQGEFGEAIECFIQEATILHELIEGQTHDFNEDNFSLKISGHDDISELLKGKLEISYFSISKVYFESGLYSEAMICCEELLNFQQAANKSDALEILTTRYNIGRIHHKMNNFKLALHGCLSFVERGSLELGEKHEAILTALHHIGMIQYDANMILASAKTFVRCLAMRRDAYGEYHPKVAETMVELGMVKMEIGSLTCALTVFMRAYDVLNKVPQQDSACCAMVLSYIAQTHCLLSVDMDKALAYYQEVLAMLEDDTGGDNDETEARILSVIGRIYLDLDEVEKAMESFIAAERRKSCREVEFYNSTCVLPGIQYFNPCASVA